MNPKTINAWHAGIKLWLVIPFTAILPTLWTRSRLRERRRNRAGLCPDCGYDLRASPDRCPECGHLSSLKFADRS